MKHGLSIFDLIQEMFGDIPNYEDTLRLLDIFSPGATHEVQSYEGYFDSSVFYFMLNS